MAHCQRTAAHRLSPTRQLLVLVLAWLGACLPPGALASPRAARGDTTVTNVQSFLPEGLRLSTARYTVPPLHLRDATGHSVDLRALFGEERATVVNFIFTSCPEICPVMTGTQLQMQRRLREDPAAPHFISITLDPDQDTPEVLANYAQAYSADWLFLTGSRTEILSVLQAFDAWRGNKMNHAAITLMRRSPKQPWTRVEGLAPAGVLVNIWNGLAER